MRSVRVSYHLLAILMWLDGSVLGPCGHHVQVSISQILSPEAVQCVHVYFGLVLDVVAHGPHKISWTRA